MLLLENIKITILGCIISIMDNGIKSIGAVIVSYNCDLNILNSINRIKDKVEKIVIVDNGSEERSKNILKNIKESKVEIIYNMQNLGIATALNIGVKKCINYKCKWILTLDQDSICEDNMIQNMLRYYYSLDIRKREKVGILAPKHIKVLDTKTDKFILDYSGDITGTEIVAEITSGNLVNVDVFEKCGYFKEELFIDYVDFEYCLRIRKYGFKIFIINEAILVHTLGVPKKIRFLNKQLVYSTHSEIRHYYIARNRLYVWQNYFKKEFWWIFIDFVKMNRDFIKLIILEDNTLKKLKYVKLGVFDHFKGRYGMFNI